MLPGLGLEQETREPLTPPGCDLRDFPNMMLDIVRLRRSKAWLSARGNPALGFYMVNLWTHSWHEVPAASLEDDDDVLAHAAMCDRSQWSRVREQVMRGWVPCSDGRFYHPVVAEKANEAWDRKLKWRKRGGAGAAARWGKGKDASSMPGASSGDASSDAVGTGRGTGTNSDPSDRPGEALARRTPRVVLMTEGVDKMEEMTGRVRPSIEALFGEMAAAINDDALILLRIVQNAHNRWLRDEARLFDPIPYIRNAVDGEAKRMGLPTLAQRKAGARPQQGQQQRPARTNAATEQAEFYASYDPQGRTVP